MGFAVEMYFDQKMEDALRGLRGILTRSGIRPVLNELGDRPHISLAVFSQLEASAFEPHLSEFAQRQPVLPVRLDGVASFPGVVFLEPEITPALIKIHSDFHGLLSKLDIRPIEYYRPGNWVPHCTMAQDVEAEVMANVLGTTRENFRSMEGKIREIGLVQFRPVSPLCTFSLAG
jgi:2'-5' RNA ligase